MEETEVDEIGRWFCKKHHRDYCHECCFDFRDSNRRTEEEKGVRQKRSELEEAAEMWAVAANSLRGMERMVPRPSEAVFEGNRQFLRKYEEDLRRFAQAGEDVETAKRRAMDQQIAHDIEREAILRETARQNPGQRNFKLGPSKSQQEIYEKVAAPPQGKQGRADLFTCAFCGKTSAEKLKMCARCKTISYCSKACQTAHWKRHKKECAEKKKEPKSLPLTWEQVEAHGGAPTSGTLEVKVMLDESITRQVMRCKDRVGTIRRIAAYTDNRRIPGLQVGSLLRWKNPRYHYFMDGSSGARIEEEDLSNITVTN